MQPVTKAILLAAGEGKRMRPLTLEHPKPMIHILGKPLLHYIIENLPESITEIVLVVGYKGEQIEKYFGKEYDGRKITYVWQPQPPQGTAHAMFLCKQHIKPGERFLFVLADDLHSKRALTKLCDHPLGVLVAEHKEPRRFGVVVPGPGNKVQAIEEKPENPKTNLVVTGVYVFDDRIFKYKLVKNERLGEYFHPELVSQLLKDHEMVIEETDFWHPIGFPHDIDAAEELLRKNERSAARQTSNIPVVILAGGKGTRMPDHEKDKPKCLVDVAGKPMLAWQIEELHKQGFFNIHLALGHKADMVVEWLKKAGHKDVSYAIEHEPLGTGGAMKLALAGANGPFVGINCDDFADVNLYSLIRHSCENTYCVLSAAEIGDARTFGLIECDDKKKICAFKEKDPNIQKGLVNIGHYYLHSDIFDGMPKAFSIEKDVFPRLAASGKLVLHSHNGYWVTANNAEQLASTRDYFEKLYS